MEFYAVKNTRKRVCCCFVYSYDKVRSLFVLPALRRFTHFIFFVSLPLYGFVCPVRLDTTSSSGSTRNEVEETVVNDDVREQETPICARALSTSVRVSRKIGLGCRWVREAGT